jgi:hypothetical protein
MRMPVDMLLQWLPQIMEGMLIWSDDSKNKFRLKVGRVFLRLVAGGWWLVACGLWLVAMNLAWVQPVSLWWCRHKQAQSCDSVSIDTPTHRGATSIHGWQLRLCLMWSEADTFAHGSASGGF